tara:strand:+ start:157 stop:345 length:189 start_codon:yes stop_codon:yes gene_type:complete
MKKDELYQLILNFKDRESLSDHVKYSFEGEMKYKLADSLDISLPNKNYKVVKYVVSKASSYE